MMLRSFILSLLAAAVMALPVQADTVTVFAAASLKTALDEITDDTDVTISYAATSTIARQIELGAPADIVITASADWMDYLEGVERLAPDTRVDLLGNRLVLIAPADMHFIAQADRPVDEIIGDARIAVALVNAVPAGIYGKEALTSLGLWDALASQAVQTDNVRAALRLVAIGETSFGIVYASDAMAEPRVQVVHRFDPNSHGPILYPMAIVAGRDRPEVRALWDQLQSPSAAAIFAENGFRIVGKTQ